MIQRIQSIYLVLALVGIVLLFIFPTATFEVKASDGIVTTSSLDLIKQPDIVNTDTGVFYIGQSSTTLLVIAILLGIGILGSIFLYKNRILQMRIVAILGLINLIYVGIMFLFSLDKSEQALAPLGAIVINYSVGIFVPLITVIFLFLAQRAIRNDEMKVRAANRIR